MNKDMIFYNTHLANKKYVAAVEADASAEEQTKLLDACNRCMNEICRLGLASEYRAYCESNF